MRVCKEIIKKKTTKNKITQNNGKELKDFLLDVVEYFKLSFLKNSIQ